jgi:hypothetical protein
VTAPHLFRHLTGHAPGFFVEHARHVDQPDYRHLNAV